MRFAVPLLPIVLGLAAAAAMLAVYLTIVGLAQGWDQALQLVRQDVYLVVPITASFGVQVGLYTYLRSAARVRSRSGRAITGASGATSTAAMVACCAHRVADLLPFLGLGAAAGFLAAYKVPFMVFGLAASLSGIAVMVRRLVRFRGGFMKPIAVFLAILVSVAAGAGVQKIPNQNQTAMAGAVAVSVTLLDLAEGGSTMIDFKVSMNTHSGALPSDMLKVAKLIGENGAETLPAAWTGGGGGHHLSGRLSFPSAGLDADRAVTLVLKGIGGPNELRFQWKVPSRFAVKSTGGAS